MAVGEPFAFSGRIVEAYYTNAEQDSVAIMYSDGETNRDYHLPVDENDDQFKALLSEYSYESLDEATRAKNEKDRQWWRDAFNDYAERNGMLGGTPEEGVQIFGFFADEVLNGGVNSLLYPILGVIGVSLTMFGVHSLNSVLQKEKEDALLSLGTFFIIIGSIGYIIVWSIDYFIIWGDPANATSSFTLEMGIKSYLPEIKRLYGEEL